MNEANSELTVLVVGTFGGGGVHQYIDKQSALMSDRVDVTLYDMVTPEAGEGLRWFVCAVLAALRAMLAFPFQRPPDVVHVHSSHRFSFYRSSFYVLFAAYVWRRPVVLHIHGSSFDKFVETNSTVVRLFQRVVFQASSSVIVLSDYWADVVEQVVSPSKVKVLPNAVEPDKYDPQFGGQPVQVVFVSNLVERKGVAELVRALEQLPDRVSSAFTVSIAGKGPYAEMVANHAETHPNAEYLGYVSEERKRALLDEGSIYVLPTHAEGLPIAILEAMAGGNAVVSSTVGSIPEVIGDAGGILVEPTDEEALADALATLIGDPDTVEEMGRRNRRQVEQRYDWAAVVDELLGLYEALARPGRLGPSSTPQAIHNEVGNGGNE